ncbi:uncharacterized protein ACA1_199560 [Acanthamoeba castellanii str. Neff]|uniref:Uncharacterized protein n=1 Tax=Acanthamoeba castellanii (strain ATCC 30010 / Neff) TaxID=1257118 RepID=L8H4L7_ACACF|nr:uncharacterized protein ACA1_199560 [Acanthamoeba castellanii str. Neff]ELR19673.1 hypothetical protein ACA1_199560 [Acanthamoeba castellanii str. Neff]
MGNFRGHAFPGTMMLMLGVVHFLRASDVSFLRKLRTSQFWITFEAFGFAFYGALGAFLEYLDGVIVNHEIFNVRESHQDHIHITSMVSMAGLLTLLHQYKVLKAPGWGLALPAGLCFIALYFTAHPQPDELLTFSHQVTAFLFFLYGVSRSAEYLVNLHLGSEHHTKVNDLSVAYRQSGRQLSSSFYLLGIPDLLRCCCRKLVRSRSDAAQETLVGIHPAYTNQKSYETVFPLITAFALFFNGVWWWEMAVSLFIQANKEEIGHNMNGMHAVHFAYSHMIYKHLLWVLSAALLVSLFFRWLESRLCIPQSSDIIELPAEIDDLDLEVDLQVDADHGRRTPLHQL